jgi:hypothetical protein
VVTRSQLLDAGINPGEIKRRLRTGSLLREHRGVYRVGHRAPSTEACYLAAVLACGEGARLSGAPAAHLLRLLNADAPAPEVITPTERHVPGITTRRSRGLDVRDGMTWRGIAVTSVPRTLVDLAAVLGVDDLARACHEAGVRHGATPADVEAVLVRRRNTRGAKKLREILRGDAHVTLSALERKFLERLRGAGLPMPHTNRPADGRRVDCRWPDHRLTVELDSYHYHGSRYAWERDRRREREAYARGDEFRRYTHGDVFDAPAPMLAELRALLV